MIPTPRPTDVTALIHEAREGGDDALATLLEAVYDELRRVARNQLRHGRQDHTLESRALVHEAYLKLAGSRPLQINDRAHFFAVAARCIRQVLVDHARARAAAKRGGAWQRTSLTNKGLELTVPLDEMLDLDAALQKMAQFAPRMVSVVEYRFFAGLREAEVAELLGLTERTVRRDWVAARTWLYKELHGAPDRSKTESD